jgi:diketogulonate reductase-like aldo/keto reductase
MRFRIPFTAMPCDRREFTKRCAAFCLSLPGLLTTTLTFVLRANADPNTSGRKVRFREGRIVLALGQGSARLGQGRHPAEEEALREGISLGMTLIDTAEIYGGGNAERLIGRVIADQRDHLFIVSKVWPTHVAGNGIQEPCEGSLGRLGIGYLDLYLLHWPNGITDFSGVVAAFEELREKGKIRAWGVSNFGASEMDRLFASRMEINARPIKSLTILATERLNVAYYHGVNCTTCP